jgi:hypothetical protein
MKTAAILPFATLLLTLAGCSGPAVTDATGESGAQADTAITTATDGSDSSCRIVLREMGPSTAHGGEIYREGKGTAWVVYRGIIDVDTRLLTSGVTVDVWYSSTLGSATVEAKPSDDPTEGLEQLHGGERPPAGYTRLAFATTVNTTLAGDDRLEPLQAIPYVASPGGHRLFDHNRTAGNYGIDSPDYAVRDDFRVCPAPVPN